MSGVNLQFKISGDYSDLEAVRKVLTEINKSTDSLSKKFNKVNTSIKKVANTLETLGNSKKLDNIAKTFESSSKYMEVMVSLLVKSTKSLDNINKKLDRMEKITKKIKTTQASMSGYQLRQLQRYENMKVEVIKIGAQIYKNLKGNIDNQSALKTIYSVYQKIGKQIEQIKKYSYEVTDALYSMYKTLSTIVNVAKTIVNTLKRIFNIISSIFNVFKIIIGSYFRIINSTISFIYNTLKSIQTVISKTIITAISKIVQLLTFSFNLIQKTISGLLKFSVNLVKTFLSLPKILSDVYRQQVQIGRSFYNFFTAPSRLFNYMQDNIGRITKDQQNVFFRIYTSIWMIKRAFGQMVEDAMNFTRQIRAIEALRVDVSIGKTAKQITNEFNRDANIISSQVKQIAMDTGADLMDVAKAYYWVVSSNITNLKNQANITEKQAYMAQMAVSPVKDVVSQATQAINAYSLSADKVNDVLYAQFELVKKGVLVYQDITSSMGKVYASARNIGVGYKQLYELVGFLSKMGMSVDKSTTALNTLFAKLANQTTINNFRKLNIELFNAQGNYRDFMDIIGDVANITEYADDQTRAWTLSLLKIPLRQQKAFLTLILHYKELIKYNKAFNKDLQNYSKNSEEALQAYLKNSKAFFYVIDRLKQEWASFTYTIQDVLSAGGAIEFFNELVNDLKLLEFWVEKNKEMVQSWIVYIGELVVTVGGIWLGLKMIGVFLNPITGMVASLVISTQKLKDKFTHIFTMFKDAFLGKGNLQDQIDNLLKQLPDFYHTALDTFTDFMKRVGIIVRTSAVALGAEFIKLFLGNSTNEDDKKVQTKLMKTTKVYTKAIYEATLLGVDTSSIEPVLSNMYSKLGKTLESSPTGLNIISWFGGKDNSGKTNLSNMASGHIDSFFNSTWDIIKKNIDKLNTKIDDYIQEKSPEWVRTPFNSIKEAVNSQIDKYKDILRFKIFNGQNNPSEREQTKMDSFTANISAFIELIKEDIQTLSDNFISWFSNWLSSNNGFLPGLYNAISNALDTFDIGNKTKNLLNKSIHKINVALFTTRFNISEEDYKRWLENQPFKVSDKDMLLPLILEFLGIGTFDHPVGTKLYNTTKGIKDRILSVLKDSFTGVSEAVTEFSQGKENFTNLMSAGAELYGSIFDALTQGFLGINMETGKLLGGVTGEVTEYVKNFVDQYTNQLNETVDGTTYGTILNSKTTPIAAKLKALFHVLLESMFDKNAVAKDISTKVEEMMNTLMDTIQSSLKKHWKIITMLAALGTHNPTIIAATAAVTAGAWAGEEFNKSPAGKQLTTFGENLSTKIGKTQGTELTPEANIKKEEQYLQTAINYYKQANNNKELSDFWKKQILSTWRELRIYYKSGQTLPENLKTQLEELNIQYTGPSGYGYQIGGYTANVQKEKPVGVVHGGEWVAPKWMVDNPVYGSIIAGLEQTRRGLKGFGDGGNPGNNKNSGNIVITSLDQIKSLYQIGQADPALLKLQLQIQKISNKISDWTSTLSANTEKIADAIRTDTKTKELTTPYSNYINQVVSGKQIDMSNTTYEEVGNAIQAVLNNSKSVDKIQTQIANSIIEANKDIAKNENIKKQISSTVDNLFKNASKVVVQEYLPNLYNAIQSYDEINDAYQKFIANQQSKQVNKAAVHTILNNLDQITKIASEGGLSAVYASTKNQYEATDLGSAIANKYVGQYTKLYGIQQLQSGNITLDNQIQSGTNADNLINSQINHSNTTTVSYARKFQNEIGTTIEDFANKNKLSINEVIQMFANAEEQRQHLFINSLTKFGSDVIGALSNLTNSLTKIGLDDTTAQNINNSLSGIQLGQTAALSISKAFTDYSSGNIFSTIIDGVNGISEGISALGSFFNIFPDNTKAIKDNTKAVIDLTNLQNRIYQKTYNGQSNITIRVEDSTGNTIQQYNQSSGADVYSVTI